MARPLSPCGTLAAARRHKKNGEEPCEPCRQAVRDEKNERMLRKREAAAMEGRRAAPSPSAAVDREAVLHEVLRTLRGQLAAAPPQSVGAIAKQIRDTLDALGAGASKPATGRPGGLSDIEQRMRKRA